MNTKAETNFTPLFYAILIIFVVGFVITIILVAFPVPENNNSPLLQSMSDGIINGFNITVPGIDPFDILPDLTFNFNPFGVLPDNVELVLAAAIQTLSYIPLFILIPLITLLTIALIWGVVKLVIP